MSTTLDRIEKLYGPAYKNSDIRQQPVSANKTTKLSKAQALPDRWATLGRPAPSPLLCTSDDLEKFNAGVFSKNVENFIGTVKVPVGVAGPLTVNGTHAKGDFWLPLATTEAALVASTNRGALVISMAGGASALVHDEGVVRSPLFEFPQLEDVKKFLLWCAENESEIKKQAAATTSHGKLIAIKPLVDGTRVLLKCEYYTGDASGQNMVTFATTAVLKWIIANCPIKASFAILEGGISSDKKASFMSFQNVRGRKVTADVIIPASIVKNVLHVTPEQMVAHKLRTLSAHVWVGSIGSTFHAANVLAASYIACGQDPACVSESHVTEKGDLYATITLPSIMVGTVGGGTGLPTQAECLAIMGLKGAKANAYAEVLASACLAAELSICAAFCSGDFAKAHLLLSRTDDKSKAVLSKL